MYLKEIIPNLFFHSSNYPTYAIKSIEWIKSLRTSSIKIKMKSNIFVKMIIDRWLYIDNYNQLLANYLSSLKIIDGKKRLELNITLHTTI